MNTADRIKQLLLDRGVAPRRVRAEIASACGITPQAVRDWFTGQTKKISPEYIATIAKRWDSSSDYLITGSNRPTIPGLEEYDYLSPSNREVVHNLIKGLAAAQVEESQQQG